MTAVAHSQRVAAGLAVRQIRLGVVALGLANLAITAAVVASFDRVDLVGAAGLGALLANPAVRALYGMPFDVTTAGGFTVWRAGTFLCVFGALWALLVTTRVLRGEEEAGRWDLLLTSPLTRGRLLVDHLGVLGGAGVVLAACVVVGFVTGGQPAGPAVLYGAGVLLLTLTFVAVAAVTSQLFAARRRAVGVAGAVLGLAYVVRMIADGVTDLSWMRWLSPLGWVENLQAFAGDDPTALVPLVLAPLVLFAIALWLDRRRDTDDGVIRDPGTATARRALLRSPLRFAWRQRLAGIAAWSAALLAFGFVLGAITDAFVDFIAGDPQIAELTAQFGYASLTTPAGFASSMIALCAAAVAVYAVTGIHRMWEDEQFDRLDLVYAAPVSRGSWCIAGVVTTAIGALAGLAATGLGVWLGCAVTGVNLSFGVAMGSAANLIALVTLFLGAAALLHGVAPTLTTAVAGGGAAALYVLSFIAPAIDAPSWVVKLSPWAHVAVAPPDPVNWAATVVMAALGITFAGAGVVAYDRRDLR